MGLDMYLLRDKNGDSYDDTNCIGYWRKSNAIHRWFVENVQNGLDDCGYYPVYFEDISKLLVEVSLELSYKGTDKASTRLIPMDGFFFGATDINRYYYEDLERTKYICVEALQHLEDGGKLYYHSSW